MASSLVRPAVLAATMLALFLLLCLGPSKWGDARAQGRETARSGGLGTHFESERGREDDGGSGFALPQLQVVAWAGQQSTRVKGRASDL